MKANPQTEREVRAALGEMTDAYRRRDPEALRACFAPDPDVQMFGTGADENRTGREELRAQAERDWARTGSIAMVFDAPAISAAGAVAWAVLDGAFEIVADGQEMSMPARATVVLEKRGERWLVLHAHFSTPAAGQGDGESV